MNWKVQQKKRESVEAKLQGCEYKSNKWCAMIMAVRQEATHTHPIALITTIIFEWKTFRRSWIEPRNCEKWLKNSREPVFVVSEGACMPPSLPPTSKIASQATRAYAIFPTFHWLFHTFNTVITLLIESRRWENRANNKPRKTIPTFQCHVAAPNCRQHSIVKRRRSNTITRHHNYSIISKTLNNRYY